MTEAAAVLDRAEGAGEAADPILAVRGLHAYYGKSHVLQGVDLTVGRGEVVALLGRNGVGRSTTVKAIMGEKSGSLEECFKVLDVDHSQGLDPGEFTTIVMCVE